MVELGTGQGIYPVILYSRPLPGLGRIHYLPKLAQLKPEKVSEFTHQLQGSIRRGVAFRMEIDRVYSNKLHEALEAAGWRKIAPVQYDHTVKIDLTIPKEELFKSFKKRARWELNAAVRRGVQVERVECTPKNLRTMFDMMKTTSKRGHFQTRSRGFSKRYWKLFYRQGNGSLYVASQGGDILSAAYIIRIRDRAY
jgi:lipid II:glycine glycyltransferase (peptidoglycan interpeptide bridge formation enzyme)